MQAEDDLPLAGLSAIVLLALTVEIVLLALLGWACS